MLELIRRGREWNGKEIRIDAVSTPGLITMHSTVQGDDNDLMLSD